VIAIQDEAGLRTNPPASLVLEEGCSLLVMGSRAQLRTFREVYE
jgi:hypothetical protein